MVNSRKNAVLHSPHASLIFLNSLESRLCLCLFYYRGTVMMTSHIKELITTFFGKQVTVTADNIPLLYVEPGVIRGYRLENKSISYYLKSIFLFHNETVNIWSHLIAFILMIKTSYDCIQSFENTSGYYDTIVCFGLCCAAYTFLSTMAHTVHSKSPTYHYICYELDYLGIGYYTLGSCILVYHFSWRESFYLISDLVFLPIMVTMSVFGFVCCTISKLYYRRPYPPQRKLWNIFSFGLQCALAFSGLLARYYDAYQNEGISNLNHHSRYIVCILVSVMFFSSHIPETSFPGTFDYIGQGHHVFHVLSALGSLQQFNAAMIDLHLYTPQMKKPFPRFIFMALGAYTVLGMVALLILYKYTHIRVKSDIQYEKAKRVKLKKDD